MQNLYNEIEPYAADWLENLIGAGHIAEGSVDRRSIRDLDPNDIGSGQFHAFAGIGVWSYALRLAGVPDDAEVWTGSCPCQPFSMAGRKKGFDDDRHLWPAWFRLIEECRPPIVFGEQVAGPDGLKWLDTVYSDLEAAGYAVGSSDLCAAGFGAPHIRQRLYFVAYADGERLDRFRLHVRQRQSRQALSKASGGGSVGQLDDTSSHERRTGRAGQAYAGPLELAGPGATGGFWAPADWVLCRDGKARPVEPGTFPLAHGAPNRVGRLRAYGNAIVSEQAAGFVKAALLAIG